MAKSNDILKELMRNKKFAQQLADPKDQAIVQEVFMQSSKIWGLNLDEPLTERDIAYFLSSADNGALYYLCGLLTTRTVENMPQLDQAHTQKLISGKFVDLALNIANAFDVKSLQLESLEAQTMDVQARDEFCFNMDKEDIAKQVPYDFISTYVKMRNYQKVINYFAPKDQEGHFVQASVILNDVMNAIALRTLHNLRDAAHNIDDPEIVGRILAMCKVFEFVVQDEESTGMMSPKVEKELLSDINVEMRQALIKMAQGNEVKKIKYLQLLEVLTLPKKEIHFFNDAKIEQERQSTVDEFLAIWEKPVIEKRDWDELDYAAGSEILEVIADYFDKAGEETLTSEDFMMFAADTNAAALYLACGIFSIREYEIFHNHMDDVEAEHNTPQNPNAVRDMNLMQLFDAVQDVSGRRYTSQRERIEDYYNEFEYVAHYFKSAAELVLDTGGIIDNSAKKYDITYAGSLYAQEKPVNAANNFACVYHMARVLNRLTTPKTADLYQKPRMLLTYLADHYYHDAVDKLRVACDETKQCGVQFGMRSMNDYMYVQQPICVLSMARENRVVDFLANRLRQVIGNTSPVCTKQTYLKRFDNIMGQGIQERVKVSSWQRKGLLDPALDSSYLKERK